MAHKATEKGTNTLRLERMYPFIVGAMTTLVLSTLRDELKKTIATDLAVPILTILAIVIGFLATALTILYTTQEIKIITRLKTTSHFNRLIDYHIAAISLGLVASLLSLCILVVCKPDNSPFVTPLWRQLFFYAWLDAVAWAFAAFVRVVLILRSIMIG